jgi:hypothetical protein
MQQAHEPCAAVSARAEPPSGAERPVCERGLSVEDFVRRFERLLDSLRDPAPAKRLESLSGRSD